METGMDQSRSEGVPDPRPEIGLQEAVRNLTEEFALMMEAGLPILRSLRIAGNVEPNSTLRTALGAMADDIEGGSTLSEAMGKRDHIFTPSYVAMVAAGEAGGVLDVVMRKMVDKLDWDVKIGTTRTPEYTSVEVRRFANALGHFISFGVPILEAINLSKEGQSEAFVDAISGIYDAIREGDSFAGPARRYPAIFDPVFIQFVDIGEETGDLDKTLIRFATRTPHLT